MIKRSIVLFLLFPSLFGYLSAETFAGLKSRYLNIPAWDEPVSLNSREAGTWLWTESNLDPMILTGEILQNDRLPELGWKETAIPANLLAGRNDLHGKRIWLLKILKSPKSWSSKHISLKLGIIDDRDRTYWNGALIGETGKFSSLKPQAYDKVRIYDIPDEIVRADSLNVVLVQIESYFDGYIGIVQDQVEIGSAQRIFERESRSEFSKLIILAIYVAVSGFFLLLFIRRKKDRENLFFGVFAIITVIYEFLHNQLKYEFGIPLEILKKIEYLCLPLIFPILMHFFRTLFGFRYNIWMKLVDTVSGIGFFYFLFFSDIRSFSTVLQFMIQPTWLFYIGAFLIMTIVSFRRGNRDAFYVLPGTAIIVIGGILDVLSNRYIIQFPKVSEYTFFIFVMGVATVLTNRFVRAAEENEELNTELEKKVQERTQYSEQLLAEVQKERSEIVELNRLLKSLNEEFDLAIIMDKIQKYLSQNFGLNHCALYKVSTDELYLEPLHVLLSGDFPGAAKIREDFYKIKISIHEDVGIHAFVISSGRIGHFPKVKTKRSLLTQEEKDILENSQMESFLVMPLVLDGKPIGVLDLSNFSQKFKLNAEEKARLSILGEQLAGIIYGSNLFQEVEAERQRAILAQDEISKKAEEIQFLNNFSKVINTENSLDVIFSEAVKELSDRFEMNMFLLQLVDQDRKQLTTRCCSSTNSSLELLTFLMDLKVPLTESSGSFFRTYETKKTLFLKNADRLPFEKLSFFDQKMREANFLSTLQIPLIVQKEVIGIMHLNRIDAKMDLSPENLLSIEAICEQLAIAVNNSRLYEEAFQAKEAAEKEKDKSENLLLNILPRDVAAELKEKGFAEPNLFESVSVMFTDFKGFTKIAENLSPSEILKDLDACFVQFDKIIERNNLEKLKTIGDSYMCAGGIPKTNKTHAFDCILAALEIQSFMNTMKEIKESQGLDFWELRLGIHSGPLVAGVIGEKKFAYDVWGDTVNTASRMESSGVPGRINISGTVYSSVQEAFECEYRGRVQAKNKGEVDMYFVNGLKPEFSKGGEGSVPNGKFWELYTRI